MEIVVEGIGIVGGFGLGVEKLSTALAAGKSPINAVTVQTPDESKEMPVFLADTSCLDNFVSKKSLRRMDHFSRMALLGSYLALQDAGMSGIDPKGLGIVVASGYGASQTTFAFLDSFIAGNDAYSSPTHFSGSVHNAAAAHISILLGINGPCLTVSQFEMSVPSALISAIHWLREERAERVLFGAVDEYCNVLGYCWHRFFGVHEGTLIEPFLFDQQTAIPGEGVAFFLLSRKEESTRYYGRIAEVGVTKCSDRVAAFHPDNTLFILGADGQKKCGQYYEQYVKKEMNITSYAPLYGSFPTNMAFDMAVACLSMKDGKVYAPPAGISCPPSLKVKAAEQVLDGSRICCLKLSALGESGMINITHD